MTRSKTFHYILGAGLILAPFVVRLSSVSAIRTSKNFFFMVLVGMLVLFTDRLKTPAKVFYPLIGLTVLAYFNTSNFINFNYYEQFQLLISYVLFLFLLISNYDHKYSSLLYNAVCISGLVQVFYIILNSFDINPIYHIFNFFYPGDVIRETYDQSKSYGSLANTNLTGAHLAFCFPCFFRSKWIKLTPFILLGVYMCNSAMPVLTVIGSSLYLLYYSKYKEKWTPWILFSAASLLHFFSPFKLSGFLSDSTRKIAWDKTMDLIYGWKSIYGYGLGHYKTYFHKYFPINGLLFTEAHNEYLQIIYNFGTIGLFLIGYVVVTSIKSTSNKIPLIGMFAFAINSYGNFPLHIASLGMLGIFYMGIALSDYKEEFCI